MVPELSDWESETPVVLTLRSLTRKCTTCRNRWVRRAASWEAQEGFRRKARSTHPCDRSRKAFVGSAVTSQEGSSQLEEMSLGTSRTKMYRKKNEKENRASGTRRTSRNGVAGVVGTSGEARWKVTVGTFGAVMTENFPTLTSHSDHGPRKLRRHQLDKYPKIYTEAYHSQATDTQRKNLERSQKGKKTYL